MSDTPPTPGQTPWGEDLNEYLAMLSARIDVVEDKPEYVFNSYQYKFNNGAPPALGGEIRLNNIDATLATQIDIHKVDGDSADRTPVLQMIGTGAKIRINDWDNASVTHTYDVTGPGVLTATNGQYPVAWEKGSGTLPTSGQAKVNVGILAILTI